uniref:Trafficking protein particle complex subunit 13 N-terminal domain-containing protein n=1 Tax=Trypanosoma vivax (strain Y486) TaxID=1055687 RepID=G0U2J1_TRYVY|nr:conserved hypothetical protein [Trypanosoma vivax Y486]
METRTSRGEGDDQLTAHSATMISPAMLAQPLSVRVAVLRKPELAQALAPELVEEGDILFDVLANPVYHPTTKALESDEPHVVKGWDCGRLKMHGIGSALSLPSSIGKHYVGQMFRAFLNFSNHASYPLNSLAFYVSMADPEERVTQLINHNCAQIEGAGNVSFTVEHKLLRPGKYTLKVVVAYTDIAREQKRLKWLSSFDTERAVVEVHRGLCAVQMTPPLRDSIGREHSHTAQSTQQGVLGNVLFPGQKHILSISLQNTSTVPLVIESLALRTKDSFEVLGQGGLAAAAQDRGISLVPQLSVGKEAGDTPRPISSQTLCNSAAGSDDFFLNPKDKRQYFFEFAFKTSALTAIKRNRSTSGFLHSDLVSNITDVGHVEWRWRLPNGDSGTDRTTRICLDGPFVQPMLELFAVSMEPVLPRVGQPLTLECVAVNYSPDQDVDAAFRVQPEKLAPAFLYTGRLVHPLGSIAPRSARSFSLTVVPWQSGWLSLHGGLELIDTRIPSRTLWPPAPSNMRPSQRATSSSAALTETRELRAPAVCEILVC